MFLFRILFCFSLFFLTQFFVLLVIDITHLRFREYALSLIRITDTRRDSLLLRFTFINHVLFDFSFFLSFSTLRCSYACPPKKRKNKQKFLARLLNIRLLKLHRETTVTLSRYKKKKKKKKRNPNTNTTSVSPLRTRNTR